MSLGVEGPTVEFIDGMEQLDDGLKAMTAMFNRYNKANVYIGVDHDGNIIGGDFSEEDVQKVIQRMHEKVNTQPNVRVTLESNEEGNRYILISGTGYETPYAFGTWFHIRKWVYSKPEPDGPVKEDWIQTLTCSMKRHRGQIKT